MITLTNPDNGKKHEMDKAAMTELREAVDYAKRAERGEVVFRAMRIELSQAVTILAADV